MNRLAVINVVGLTEALIGEHTPRLAEFRKRGALAHIAPAFPAVTCTAQSNYLTGKTPSEHGIVGNGWFNRELTETQFWKQSNHIVHGPKIWDALREQFAIHNSQFTVSNCFWWFNMYSSVDYAITPRPMYPADGRKLFDIYSWPYSIREAIKRDLGDPAIRGAAAAAKAAEAAVATAKANVHARVEYGRDDHHQAEALFKALGRALDAATTIDPRRAGLLPSTKGTL